MSDEQAVDVLVDRLHHWRSSPPDADEIRALVASADPEVWRQAVRRVTLLQGGWTCICPVEVGHLARKGARSHASRVEVGIRPLTARAENLGWWIFSGWLAGGNGALEGPFATREEAVRAARRCIARSEEALARTLPALEELLASDFWDEDVDLPRLKALLTEAARRSRAARRVLVDSAASVHIVTVGERYDAGREVLELARAERTEHGMRADLGRALRARG